MTPHNHAKPGDYAAAVLLPGDPLRAKWIAERFFEAPRQVNGVRNCLGFTGTWKGKPVSVQATGMGQPSLTIYAHELLNIYGVKTLIRVGTCGGLNAEVKVRDLIIAQGASTDSAIVRDAFGGYNFSAIADFDLLADAVARARAQNLRAHVGNLLSSDIFYHADGLKAYETLMAHGVLGVEMEAAALYMLCARFKARGLAICTMTDCLITHEQLSAEERQSSLVEMITLSLDVAVGGVSVLDRLASALGRNDERPNVELAEDLAAGGDEAGIAELVAALATGPAVVANDAIKTLYEVGERRPELIAGYTEAFLLALRSKNNRLVWGAMTALDTIAVPQVAAFGTRLSEIVAAADRGSVIAKDKAVSILCKLVAAGNAAARPPLFRMLENAAVNQLPSYAEAAASAIASPDRGRFAEIIALRLPGVPQAAKRARLEKVLRRLEKN